jgi:cytoskeletal protein CcmA (bactofilin family)
MFGKGSRPEQPAPVVKGTHDTIVGTGCKVSGDLVVRGSVLIRGEVEGAIQVTDDVDVELGARVRGDIRGERARVAGKIEGNVKVRDSLELQQGAHLHGDVYARSFRIQDGAIFQGNCHMGKQADAPILPGEGEGPQR